MRSSKRNDDERNGRSGGTIHDYKVALQIIISIMICLWLQYHMLVSTNYNSLNNGDESFISPDPQTKMFGHRTICPGSLNLLNTDDVGALRAAYDAAEAFHNRGGGLKNIETYLNSHIDDTLKRLDVQYFPKGSGSPLQDNESVKINIRESLKANDHKEAGGYDQRKIPGSFSPNKNKMHERHVDVLEPFNLERWEFGLGPVVNLCKSMDSIGKSYEEKFMCSFQDLQREKSAGTNIAEFNQRNCEMISIGSNRQWDFEESVVTTTNCVTHTFDCTTRLDPRKPASESIHFYPYCISHIIKTIDEREYTTYFGMTQAAGMKANPPALFKLDVEGFEYDVLTQMLEEAMASGTMDLLPLQISVELHYATRMYDVPWMLRTITTAEIAMFVGIMYRMGGYMLVHQKFIGPGCYPCAELLFVRVLCE